MYRLNEDKIDVYVVFRASFGNDIILRNYTKDKIICIANFKNDTRAVNECKKIQRIIEFLGGEKHQLTHQHEDKGE